MLVDDRNEPRVAAPTRRRLHAFAFDPMSTRLSGRRLPIDVPFETLQPGPVGELIKVVDYDGSRDVWYRPVDLDDQAILAQGGLRPTEGDPRTHQQVVYAVAMSVIERFERFLGRRFRWRRSQNLVLVPHAFEGRKTFFDPTRRAVLFGYYRADDRDPKAELLAGLERHKHRVVRADQPKVRRAKGRTVTVHEDLWSEIRFPVPTR